MRGLVAVVVVLSFLVALPGVAVGQVFQSEGTRRMAERLERIAREADPELNPFLNAQRAALLERRIAEERALPEPNAARLINLEGEYALELLQAGRSLEAVRQFERVLGLHRAPNAAPFRGRRDASFLRNSLALAWLRLGEQENCLSNHTARSCILPVDPSAVHPLPRGSRQAIGVLREQLAEHPEDLQARWLLNLAHMTLGEYPAQVPSRFLIPPEVFRSSDDIGRFENVAGDLGLDVPDLSGGCITEDFDGDGDLDLVASSLGLRDPLRYFRNNGDGTFTERTEAAGLVGEVGGLNLLQTDYNNDGFADVLVLRGGWFGRGGKHPKSLLKNRGDGTFEDVTEEAGLLSLGPTQTAVWFDYDGDGWLDVYFGHESREGDVNPCQLFHNQRDGTFREVGEASGVAVVGWVKGVVSGDYNNDGRPDLYLSRLGESNLLFRNDGPRPDGGPGWRFTDVTAAAGVGEPLHSFPTWFFDYDNDGCLDLFVSGYRAGSVGDVAADYLGMPHGAERPRLYRNRGDGTFADVTREAGLQVFLLGMGSNFGDLDNDGWLDFYVGTGEPDLAALLPNRMFRNAGGKVFRDITTSGGFGHLQKGHGVAFADLDEDGDQDVYEVMGGAFSGDTYRNVLFENPGHGNRWVKLRLEGVRANRAALGARVAVTVTGAEGRRVVHRVVGSGGSFGASPFRLEIGLGRAERIERIEIRWPGSETRQTLVDVPMGVLLTIREGDPSFRVVRLKGVRFAKGAVHVHH